MLPGADALPGTPITLLQLAQYGHEIIVAKLFELTDRIGPRLTIRLVGNHCHKIIG